jgi:hypothetical protein
LLLCGDCSSRNLFLQQTIPPLKFLEGKAAMDGSNEKGKVRIPWLLSVKTLLTERA